MKLGKLARLQRQAELYNNRGKCEISASENDDVDTDYTSARTVDCDSASQIVMDVTGQLADVLQIQRIWPSK